MSNVLIGIIGVILFIGLALAGALFLGPRFQESTNNSKAASVQQAVSQMAHAAAMYQVDAGKPLNAGPLNTSNDLYGGYMKSLPNNPVRSTPGTIGFLDSTGTQNTSLEAKAAIMVLNGDDVSRSICETIDRASGRTAPGQTFDAGFRSFSNLVGNAGCQNNGSAYIAFVKV